MAVPAPPWKLKPPEIENGDVEDEALAEEPVVVVCAMVAENTGWRLRAELVLAVVLVAVEAATVVPAPAWALKVPLATAEPAVAVVSAAAEATPAKPSMATAAAAAKNFFIMGYSLLRAQSKRSCPAPAKRTWPCLCSSAL